MQNLLQKIKHHHCFAFLYQNASERLIDSLFGLNPDLNCVVMDDAIFFDMQTMIQKYLYTLPVDAAISSIIDLKNSKNKKDITAFFYLNRISYVVEKELKLLENLDIDTKKSFLKNINLQLNSQQKKRILPEYIKYDTILSQKNQNVFEKIKKFWRDFNKKPKHKPLETVYQKNIHPPINLLFKNLSYIFASPEEMQEDLRTHQKNLAPEALLMLSHLGIQTAFSLRQFLLNNISNDVAKTEKMQQHSTWLKHLGCLDMHDLGDILSYHYSNPVVHSSILKIEYETPGALWHDICMLEHGALFNQKEIEDYWEQQPFLEIELITAHAWNMKKSYIDEAGSHVSVIDFQKR